MAIKSRADLKAYFVKNAIPTQGNYADLIDSQLNQSEDGVFRPEGEPLSVVAASGDQKRVLRLHENSPAANPDWVISLNPAQDPANPATTGKPGFGITDGAGQTRLFVDKGTGRVGVGTNEPQAALDVAGAAQVQGLSVTGAIVPSVGSSESNGILFPGDPGGGGGDRAFIRYFVEGGESTKLRIGNNNDANDRLTLFQQNADRLTVYAGNVGINNSNPSASLDVTGSAKVSGNATIAGSATMGGDATIAGTASVTGTLTALGGLIMTVSGSSAPAHLEEDGALYRHAGEVYLTVDNHFYIRQKNGSNAAHFTVGNGNLSLRGKVIQGSDLSLKRDIEPLRSSLEKILALRGVSYRRRDVDDDALHVGLIAQEVERVFPEVVSAGSSGELGIAYTGLVAPLIEAVKELHAEVARLRALVGPNTPGHREPPDRA